MLNFTFLKGDQIWGDNALDVMKRYGTKVAPTDLTAISGGLMSCDDCTSENDLTCVSWSASSFAKFCVLCVFSTGNEDWYDMNERMISARPALPPSEAFKISLKNIHKGPNGAQIGEYGEYPQMVAGKETSAKLEKLLETKSLRSTGKKYVFNSVDLDDYHTSFNATSYPEYEMDGKKYIRVFGRPYDEYSKLSTGEWVRDGKPYWVEIQPIEWLMDKSGWMVSKKCLFSGIQFDTKFKYYGDFSKTSMKRYLDTYFAKEIEPVRTREQVNVVSKKQQEAAHIAAEDMANGRLERQ